MMALLLLSTLAMAEDWASLVGKDFLHAEQVLMGKVGPANNPRLKRGEQEVEYRLNSNLPTEFTPGAQQTFKLISLLIPSEELDSIQDLGTTPGSHPFVLTRDGRKYVRFLIHPDSADHYEEEIAKYPADSTNWYGTPTSSYRTLLAKSDEPGSKPYFIKTSLYRNFLGDIRQINESSAKRAVTLNQELESIHHKSQGQLPSGKKWSYMPETFAVLPPGKTEGAFIARPVISEFSDPSLTVLPFYALTAVRDGQEPWIEELFKKSGYSSKREFAWNEIVKPMLELHELLSVQNGVSTDIHTQNGLFAFDKRTGKIVQMIIRDNSGMYVDQLYRGAVLKLPELKRVQEGQDLSKLLGYGHGMPRQAVSYFFFRDYCIEFLFNGWLSKAQKGVLLARADEHYVNSVNKTFGNGTVRNILGVTRAWKSMHDSHMTPAYAALAKGSGSKNQNSIMSDAAVTQRNMARFYRLKQMCRYLTEALTQ